MTFRLQSVHIIHVFPLIQVSNKTVDIKFSAHDSFLEQPSSGKLSAVLTHGHAEKLPGGPASIETPMLIYAYCGLLSINK